ncbi:MAG: 3-phosphoglycerate dehydrogenase [Anaerolineae bacterium]|nr:3-phosphoglycerate dehydrogenase [Anaerolineae bacterium]
MTTVLVATEKPFDPQAVDGIRAIVEEAGFTFDLLEKYTDPAQLMAAAAQADALIVRSDKVTAALLDAAPNLKIVVRAGAGYDTIDLAACTAHSVVVENTPGQNADAVAELAIAMMLYQARGHFDGGTGTELKGKTLGIHAFGNVGSRVAHLAKGFGMTVYAFDPFLADDTIEAAGVIPVHSVEELYSACQYVSLHIPATPRTIGSINYGLLSRMPGKPVLVNTARGEVIDETDLLKMFAENPFFQYISDIAPGCKAQLIETYPDRCFFTPKKMGAQTLEANVNAGLAAAEQIVQFFTAGDTRFQVNR